MTVSDEDYDRAYQTLWWMDEPLHPSAVLDAMVDLGWRPVVRSDQAALTDKDMTDD